MATDWVRQWAALLTVTSLPDGGAEFMIGDEDAPNDVINRTAKQLDAFLVELAASGLGGNLIPNGSFGIWPGDVTNIAPVGFTLKGTPTDVSRDTGERDNYGGAFAAKITSNGAGNEGLTIILSNLKSSTDYYVTVRAKATAGDTARIWTTGGSTNLDTNTASTSFVTLFGKFTTDATPTNIVLNFGSNTATDIVWFDKLMVQEGEVPAIYITENTPIGGIVQVRYLQTGAVNTGTIVIPLDDSIPTQSGPAEGDEYMTLDIAPSNANNKLLIEIVWFGAHSAGTGNQLIAALFQDAIAAALATGVGAKDLTANGPGQAVFKHEMTAGTTNIITFKIRAGSSQAGTTTFNGQSGARKFGGVMASSIRITEIKQ